jgi:hypothetical protein
VLYTISGVLYPATLNEPSFLDPPPAEGVASVLEKVGALEPVKAIEITNPKCIECSDVHMHINKIVCACLHMFLNEI